MKDMNVADKYFIETLKDIKENGVWCKEPRTRWKDGEKSYYKSIHQKHYRYEIDKGEFPINTLRNTALKGAFYDVEAIYIKQTNILEEMHPSIHNWWKDFVVKVYDRWMRTPPSPLEDKITFLNSFKLASRKRIVSLAAPVIDLSSIDDLKIALISLSKI